MRPANTHRKLRIRGDSIGSASKYKLDDPISPRDSNLDSSDSDNAPDSSKKIKTLPDYQPYSKERDPSEKSKNATRPHFNSLPLKNLMSFPEIATERIKQNPPALFERNLYDKERTMTNIISDYDRRTSKSNTPVAPPRKSLNYVVLGKNLYLAPAANAEKLTKRPSLPPCPSFRRLKTDVEERPPRMRTRHQKSIENINVPLTTCYQERDNSKSSIKIERTSYSKSPDEKTDLNTKSFDKIAHNFFLKNKDKFQITTSLRKRAAQLSKEKFSSSKSEWLNKALASNKALIKPQFKVL